MGGEGVIEGHSWRVLDPTALGKLKFKLFNRFGSLSRTLQVVRAFPDVAPDRVAVTIGNFDGVHRGHRAMLTRLVGHNSMVCLSAIPILSLPLLAAAMLGLRHGAPSRPALALRT